MKDEILSKMLEGMIAGLMSAQFQGTFDVKIEGLKTKDDGRDIPTVEKITITPSFCENEGVTASEDEDQSL